MDSLGLISNSDVTMHDINSTLVLHFYRKYAQSITNRAFVTSSSFLSIIGAFMIISSFVLWKDIRSTSRSVLVCLSIADLAVSLGYAVSVWLPPWTTSTGEIDNNDLECIVLSFVTSSANIISLMWSVSLAIYIYLTLVKDRPCLAHKLLPLFHATSWFTGPIINAIALSNKMLGNSADEVTAGWCWIVHNSKATSEQRQKEIIWMFVDGKLMEISAYLFILALYLSIKAKLQGEVGNLNF